MLGKPKLVPSPAALRVLRRLAYISSGTACGTAAVVLEEQRRRVHFARQIADNAARLRQHPRRIHGATELYEDTGEPWLYTARSDDFRVRQQSSNSQDRYAPSAQNPDRCGKRTGESQARIPRSKAPFLPSEVDAGYAKLSARDRHDCHSVACEPRRRRGVDDASSGSSLYDWPTVHHPRSIAFASSSAANIPHTTRMGFSETRNPVTSALPVRSHGVRPEAVTSDGNIPTEHRGPSISDLPAQCRQSPYRTIRDLESSLANKPIPVQRLQLIRSYTQLTQFDQALDLLPQSKITSRVSQWTDALSDLLTLSQQASGLQATIHGPFGTMLRRITNRIVKEKLARHMLEMCIDAGNLSAVSEALSVLKAESHVAGLDVTSLAQLLLKAIGSREWPALAQCLSALVPGEGAPDRTAERCRILEATMSELCSKAGATYLFDMVNSLYQHCDVELYHTVATVAAATLIQHGEFAVLGSLLTTLQGNHVVPRLAADGFHSALRKYYIANRPTAIQLGRMIDDVKPRTSGSQPEAFEALLAEAAAYDLRKLKGLPGATRFKRSGLRKAAARALVRLTPDEGRRLTVTGKEPQQARGSTVPAAAEKERLRHLLSFSLEGGDFVPVGGSKEYDLCIPVLQAQIRLLIRDGADFDQILRLLWRYYRKSLSMKSGTISHYLTVTTARELISHGMSQQAVTLLRAIDASPLAAEQPMDIAAMTVLLHAYVKLRNTTGIEWVRERVLGSGMRVDLLFVKRVGSFRKDLLKSSRTTHGTRIAATARALVELQVAVRMRRAAQRTQDDAAVKAIINLFGNRADGQGSNQVDRPDAERGRVQREMPKPHALPASQIGASRPIFNCDRTEGMQRLVEVA